jgi:hypothetical protein
VFDDLNGTAVPDPGEPGLAGWTVFIDNDRDSVLDPGEASALTDANGYYSIDTTSVPLVSGVAYYVGLVLETGTAGRWVNTTATFDRVRTDTDPADATRSFGAQFRSDADAGFATVGPEQLVNVETGGQQGNGSAVGFLHPVSVSADAAGNYVVAWRTAVAGASDVVYARVFNADGSPRTGDLTVSTEPPPAANAVLEMPEVAMADNGRFVVGWASTAGPKVRVYAADGSPATGPVVAAAGSATVGNHFADVATDAVGNFVVVYAQTTKDHFGHWGTPAVKAQRFTAAGAASGNPISVASLSLVNGLQSVAMADAGSFVVVWDDTARAGRVFAQRYTAGGKAAGSAVVVSADAGVTWLSNVAMNGAGQFVVSWENRDVGTKARVYTAAGAPAGPATLVTAKRAESQAGLAIDDAGTVTVAWTDTRQPASAGTGTTYGYGVGEVRARRLTAAGQLTPDTLVNATTQGVQSAPGVAVLPTGGFVAAWGGYGPGDDAGIFAQRFGPVGAGGGVAASSTLSPETAGALDVTGLDVVNGPNKKERR